MPGTEMTGRGWTQGGAGESPLSEPEIRSTSMFLIRNPNVGAVNSTDTPADTVVAQPEFILNGTQRKQVVVRLKLNGTPAGNATVRLESTGGGVVERTVNLG